MSTPEDRYRRTPQQDDQYTREQEAAGAPPYDPDAEPATQGDVKSLRRWLIVAAAWAVAASVIAIIALIDDDTGGNGDSDAPSSRAVTRVERRLEARIEELERRVEQAPSSDDIEELNNRIGEVEGQVEDLGSPASEEDIDELTGRIEELEQRVEDLENQPPPEDGQ